mmetsp:Transcript_24756/g.67974  ORF Transcript_24756/g.67974 Transcript_24756/m.67974 type:complete len:289 (-) Transcript_24756:109-975(-)
MALLLAATSAVALLTAPRVAEAFDADIISDIEVGSLDEGRALGIKSEQFWRPVLQAAKRPELQGHAALYADAEAAIAGLGPEHAYVRSALGEALERLRRADEAVLAQAQQHEELAADQLARPPTGAGSWAWGGGGGSVPLLTGGRGFVSWAVQRFTDFGGYFKRLRGHVAERLANVTPALRGAAASARDVLGDCRVASGRAFDVLKYDIYERDAPKTPQAAKDVAHRIVDAATETRRRFLGLVTAIAEGITRDAQSKGDQPSATVTHALLKDMEPLPQRGSKELRISL